jgi:hypothetical protein
MTKTKIGRGIVEVLALAGLGLGLYLEFGLAWALIGVSSLILIASVVGSLRTRGTRG